MLASKSNLSGTLPLENDGDQVVVRIVRVLTRPPAAKAAGVGRRVWVVRALPAAHTNSADQQLPELALAVLLDHALDRADLR